MKKIFARKIKFTSCLFGTLFSGSTSAEPPSLVSKEIPYQTFRDFATNRGPFSPGANNIVIRDKNGTSPGVMNKAPMPDFSSVDRRGVATIVAPQYAISVYHNYHAHFLGLNFGNGYYDMVGRDNISDKDFSVIRLNKVVTESIPSVIFPENMDPEKFQDPSRFPIFYRIGSGTQEIKDKEGNITRISSGYRFLTGGTTGTPYLDSLGRLVTHSGDIFNPANGPVSSFALAGDSGSPLFAWDALQNKWLVVATLSMTTDYRYGENVYSVIPPNFVTLAKQNYSDPPVVSPSSNALMVWRFNPAIGGGTITQGEKVYAMHGQRGESAHHGKDLAFSGVGGVLLLQDDINQGAGSLTFYDSYTLMPQNAQTWVGGGVNVASGAKVIWQVNGMPGDNLHKIGAGILQVNGRGINPGGLKVGDGTVVLAQLPDKDGKVQAFSSVDIASGRPLVVLTDARQLNLDSVSWRFRGGKLDAKGNDLTFRQLNAADHGAVLTNTAQKRADITLNYQGQLADMPVREWQQARKGTPGDVYGYQNSSTGTTDYFLLKGEKYSWFPLDQRSDAWWEFIGHDRDAALSTAFARRKAAGYMFHGQFNDNMNILNRVEADTRGALALDGSVAISGSFTQENGHLIFQGHPVIHAYNSPETAEKLKGTGDNSLRTQPVSFLQQDWERRTFKLANLVLKNTHFHLARNASLYGKITAHHSAVTLGSPSLYLDLNDGGGVTNLPQSGTSRASRYDDLSRYEGAVSLADNSVLTIREKFTGSITGQNSNVNVASRYVLLDGHSSFHHTPLTLEQNAKLTARAGWTGNSTVTVGPSATLVLTAMPVQAKQQVIPSFYTLIDSAGYELKEESVLRVSPFVFFTGDIHAPERAVVHMGTKDNLRLADKLTPEQQKKVVMFGDFKNSWHGNITAPQGRVNVTETRWQIPGKAQVADLSLVRSLVSFSGSGKAFNTLTVENLRANKSGIVLRTDLQGSDKVVVTKRAKGQNNTLFLDLLKKPSGQEKIFIPLVIVPTGTSAKMFKFAGYVSGFSQLQPVMSVRQEAGTTQWILKGFESRPDPAKTAVATRFLGLGYKKFITLVNNVNKRMGELRDTREQAGLWVRTTQSSGSGEEGYADNYMLLQAGFDRKHRQQGADLFTGVMVSYSHSHARDREFRGNTRSFGGGLYASAIFDSGAWLDVIGKYIQHKNDYQLKFAGPGQQNDTTHSWYGGLEMGYRYHLATDFFIEPQAELVYGAVSGTRLKWQEQNTTLAIYQKKFNPLIGRAGVTVGKRFSGENWAVTLRGGLDYQVDLQANGTMVLRDAWAERHTGGKKDSRMLYHVGLNGEVKDNLRFGLEVERSAFGRYNMNHTFNANIRYSF